MSNMADVIPSGDSRNTIAVCVSSTSVNRTISIPDNEISTEMTTKVDDSIHTSNLDVYEDRGLPMVDSASEIIVERFEVQEPRNSVLPATPRWLSVLRQASCYLCLYVAGYNGGVTGTLLPSIEKQYNLTYSSVSLLFVSYCIGYLLSAVGSGRAIKSLGFGWTLLGAGVMMMLGIIINCSQLVSFPLMCFAYVISGLGFSSQLGMANSYFCTLSHPLLRMGVLHGTFGFGAFTSPIVASLLISHNIKFKDFYFTSLAIIILSNIVAYIAFVHGKARYVSLPEDPTIISATPAPKGSLREVLKKPEVWILATFLLLYVGAEESIGGWIVSYLEVARHGNASGAAWVASGFYLGLAVGRVCLPIINHLVGERRIVLFYLLIAGAFQAISWGVKSFVATAVATSLIGFSISTFYTAAIHAASTLLPRRMHTNAMVIISGMGQMGSALFPFVIGTIGNKKGIWVVQPSVLALFAGQFCVWLLVPKSVRRQE